MFAQLENGVLYPCPQHGCDGGGRPHTNLRRFYERNPDIAVQDGYYPVTHTDKPDGDYLPSWELQEVEGVTMIVQVWTPYTPQPEPIPVDIEKLRADVDYIAMMEDIDLEG